MSGRLLCLKEFRDKLTFIRNYLKCRDIFQTLSNNYNEGSFATEVGPILQSLLIGIFDRVSLFYFLSVGKVTTTPKYNLI